VKSGMAIGHIGTDIQGVAGRDSRRRIDCDDAARAQGRFAGIDGLMREWREAHSHV
jgi:hypothetical protein